MVEKILELIQNNDSRGAIIEKGAEWAQKSFNQEVIWKGILEVYLNLVSDIQTNRKNILRR